MNLHPQQAARSAPTRLWVFVVELREPWTKGLDASQLEQISERHFELIDVLIDSTGVFIGVIATRWLNRRGTLDEGLRTKEELCQHH